LSLVVPAIISIITYLYIKNIIYKNV